MQFGKFKIRLHNFGNFKLDGGSMFGAVPKTIWSKIYPCDDKNRITMASNSLIIESGDKKILIDDGVGSKCSEKFKEIYGIESYNALKNPELITDIIFTHLHFDHCGGVSYFDKEELKATYPNATIHIQEENLKLAQNPSQREKASYLKENVEIVSKSKLNTLNGDSKLFDYIEVFQSNGHTKGLQWIKITTENKVIVFPSDLLPTSRHIPLVYHLGFDMNVKDLLIEKGNFLQKASKENWLVVFQHDPNIHAGYIIQDNSGKYMLKDKLILR